MSPSQQRSTELPPRSNGAYLLRYWRDYADNPNYHFMLKSVETGERVLFQDMTEMLGYLREKLLEKEECVYYGAGGQQNV